MTALNHAQLVDQFKAAFRIHPAGVGIVTALTPDGPVGLTASSIASVSADPPVLVFSVSKAAGSASAVLAADTFLVHLLHADNLALARRFAVSGTPRFTDEHDWSALPTGEPRLGGTGPVFRARARTLVPVESSTVVIANILDIDPGTSSTPLVYHDRVFHTLAEHTALP